MIPTFWRFTALILILFSSCFSYHTPFSFPVDYQSIKEVLQFAKSNPSRINHARTIALDFTSQNGILNIKDAMCCVSIFKLASDPTSALKVVENMDSRNITVDTFLYNNVISVCSKTKDWRLAIDLLLVMQNKGVSIDTISFSSAISACAKAGRWRESLNLLNEMAIAGIVADTICYSSAISACASAGCWKEALLLLSNMKSKNIPLDTIVCNSAISACSSSGEWTVALRLMDLMRTEGLIPNAYTYASAMSACDVAGECNEALSLLEKMLSSMIPPLEASASSDSDPSDMINSRRTTLAALDILTATVPFNIAIAATAKCGRISKAKELFYRMGLLGVPRNAITYTTVITGITKSKNFDQKILLDIHQLMVDARIRRNAAVFGAVIAAAERVGDCKLTLNLLQQMKSEGVETSTFVYHSAISACGKAEKLEEAMKLLEEMKFRKIERTSLTYCLLMNACRRSGEWESAMQLLKDMELDFNDGVELSVDVNDGVDGSNAVRERQSVKPDTIAYSSAISVCVVSKQWGLALELLERMEEQGIQRNVVTYNTVIEALSNAEETARAELVYQSALRTGVYNHWHRSSQHYTTQRDVQIQRAAPEAGTAEVMDLHNFPVAAAKAAVMLVLGEMCAGSIPIPDPLILITGRGNHASVDGRRGILRRELLEYCSNFGLELCSSPMKETKSSTLLDKSDSRGRSVTSKSMIIATAHQGNAEFHSQTSNNPGRLWLTKDTAEQWLEEQKKEHEALKSSGLKGVHGNLFLKVAMAKRQHTLKNTEVSLNVRAVCPYSTATHANTPADIPCPATDLTLKISTLIEPTADASQPVEASEGPKCPMHVAAAGLDTTVSVK
jgi:pentatricopeptide repeat domain-containing protein 1